MRPPPKRFRLGYSIVPGLRKHPRAEKPRRKPRRAFTLTLISAKLESCCAPDRDYLAAAPRGAWLPPQTSACSVSGSLSRILSGSEQ